MQEKIKYIDVMDLGFKRIDENDTVFLKKIWIRLVYSRKKNKQISVSFLGLC